MSNFTQSVRAGVLVAVLVAATSVAGCSAHQTRDLDGGLDQARDSGDRVHQPEDPDDGVQSGTVPPTTPPGGTDGYRTEPGRQPLSAWPAKPFTDSAPFRWDTEHVAIAVGYKAVDFRSRMQNAWHLSKGSTTKKKDFTGRSYRIFTDKLKNGEQLLADVVGLEDEQGNLQQVICEVYENAPRPAAFLKDCASLDYPKANPAKAAAWEETYRPQLDALLVKKTSWVSSPLFSAGGTSMFMRHSRPAMTSDGARIVYRLFIFGTGEPDSK